MSRPEFFPAAVSADRNVADVTATRGSIHILDVTGIEVALYSLTKPFMLSTPGDFLHGPWRGGIESDRIRRVADRLAKATNGEEKFLRFINVYMEINAPRDWWSHMDTYHFTVMQSESTTHKLRGQHLTMDNFDYDTSTAAVKNLIDCIAEKQSISAIKKNVPEGFLQSRVIMVNYNTLRTIWVQRTKERLDWWENFLGMYPVLPCNVWITPEVQK